MDSGRDIAAIAREAGRIGPSERRDLGESPIVPGEGLLGASEAFDRLLKKIPRLASSDATVLITGETGTGKELMAHAIHGKSQRHDQPFIPVNCGALPEDLVENELFGHARGAYTGAAGTGRGLLAEAEGGTLFLDELNSLSLSVQAKLLRFLQNREYRALGSTRLMHANVRIIAATNIDLGREIAKGSFRADLFHRLHVLSVEMPPLRTRLEDIHLLVVHFAEVFGKLYGRTAVRFSAAAMVALEGHDWPGNVRELQGVVERAILLAPLSEISPDDLGLTEQMGIGEILPSDAQSDETVPGSSRSTEHQAFREAKNRTIRQFEQEYLIRVMAAVDGNVSKGARLAGMQRRDFQRLLRKHDVRGSSRWVRG